MHGQTYGARVKMLMPSVHDACKSTELSAISESAGTKRARPHLLAARMFNLVEYSQCALSQSESVQLIKKQRYQASLEVDILGLKAWLKARKLLSPVAGDGRQQYLHFYDESETE